MSKKKWMGSIFGDDDKKKKNIHSEARQEEPHKDEPKQVGQTMQPLDITADYGNMPVEDVAYEFERMDSLLDEVHPHQENQGIEVTQSQKTSKESVKPPEGNKPQESIKTTEGVTSGASLQKDSKPPAYIQPQYQPKPFIPKIIEVDTKLTIILVENTTDVFKEKATLEKIAASLVTTGKVCVINYGMIVLESKIIEAKKFNCRNLLCEDYAGDDACLYDALLALETIVDENYKKAEESKNSRVTTKSIEIIGIGRCMDNCSITSREIAFESFCKAVKRPNVTTKYYCLNESGFVEAATIGFHSIGSISRNYK